MRFIIRHKFSSYGCDYILHLRVNRQESNTAVPSLLNVHGLATTGLESSEEGKGSEEEEELVQRLDK